MTTPLRPRLDGLRILVADDNSHIRTLVSTLLHALGRPRAVAEACCGECALDILAADPVDVAIVDWRMTPVDGVALVRTLRGQAHTRRLPVIMMSGRTEPHHTAAMWAAGADAVLAKPLGLRRFAATLAAATAPRC